MFLNGTEADIAPTAISLDISMWAISLAADVYFIAQSHLQYLGQSILTRSSLVSLSDYFIPQDGCLEKENGRGKKKNSHDGTHFGM